MKQPETINAGTLDRLLILRQHVEENTKLLGCREMSLGIVKMPPGYALMLNGDESHFYWLRYDGVESVRHWNRWAVYRGAQSNAAKQPNDQANRPALGENSRKE